MQRRVFLASAITGAIVLAAAEPAPAAPARQTFSVDADVALHAYQAVVEEHMSGILRAIRALARTADAGAANWTSIKPSLDSLARDLSTDATTWFALPDGSYFTTEGGRQPGSLANRAYFPTLLAGRDVVGSLVISRSTGHRSIIVATPVLREGRVIGVIGVSLRARLLSQLVIDRAKIPENMTFYALDRTGQTAIHKDPELMFQFPSDIGDASLKSAVAVILSHPSGTTHYRFRGVDKTAVFDRSDLTGWHFVLVKVK
jgi:hypothetical protein